MTVDEFAKKYPRLFHITSPCAVPLIRKYGLLSTKAILELCEVPLGEQRRYMRERRPHRVVLKNRYGEEFELNDNRPFSKKALSDKLEDGLTPEDWLDILNRRAFFWTSESKVRDFHNASANANTHRVVLTFDSKRLLLEEHSKASICPFNSGATRQSIPRRGLSTFAPLSEVDYEAWRRRRGLKRPDRVCELTIEHRLAKAFRYLVS